LAVVQYGDIGFSKEGFPNHPEAMIRISKPSGSIDSGWFGNPSLENCL
jgi:hypothetical protein